MCRVPKIVVVAPEAEHDEIRRTITSIAYDVVAMVSGPEEIDVEADAALALSPDAETVASLSARGLKVAVVGEEAHGADVHIPPGELASFKERVWELFRVG